MIKRTHLPVAYMHHRARQDSKNIERIRTRPGGDYEDRIPFYAATKARYFNRRHILSIRKERTIHRSTYTKLEVIRGRTHGVLSRTTTGNRAAVTD